MQVPHNAFVLVADGRKALFFRNEGDAEFPNLQVEHAEERVNPADRDQKTDAAGGASATQMGTMDEVDFHQQEEDRFAADTADMLLLDVVPLSLGVAMEGNIFANVVPRGTTVPTIKKVNCAHTIMSDYEC